MAAGAFAQPRTWQAVDWSAVTAAQVKSLLAADTTGAWKAVPPSPVSDPLHRLPPDPVSALLLAVCYSRDAELVSALIEAGADAKDTGGLSPLMYAAQYNPSTAVIETLVAAGAKVKADIGWTFLARPALTYAAQYNENPEMVAYLVKKGASLNAKVSVLDNMGFAPLMYAAQYNSNPAVIRQLVALGAQVNMTDAMGRNALVFAAQYNPRPQILEALLKAGSAVNIVGRDYYNVGFTPLMYAAVSEQNPLQKLGLLLDAGADPKLRSKEGKTASDYASANPLVPMDSPVLARLKG